MRHRVHKLQLENYSSGRHIAALKVVHLSDDKEGDFFVTKLHKHNFYELVAVIKGSGTHEVNGERNTFRSGMVFLLHPKDRHRYFYSEQLTLLTFMFDKKILRQFKRELEKIPHFQDLFHEDQEFEHKEVSVDTATLAELDILLNTIAMAGLSKLPGAELIQITNFINALVLILQNIHSDTVAEYIDSSIGIAVSYMLRNFRKKITLSELAKMANMSQSTFCRNWRKDFDMPPMVWLMRLRIRKAMNFLTHSDMTIGDVAESVGFPDPLYFSRQFHKFTGLSPQSYRNRDNGVLHTIHYNHSDLENTNLSI